MSYPEQREQAVVRELFKRYNMRSDSTISLRFDSSNDKAFFIRSCAKYLIDKEFPLEDYYEDRGGGGQPVR